MMPCLQVLKYMIGEDPSRFEGWLDAMEQACNMTDRKPMKRVDEEVNWSHQRNTLDDEHSLDQW